MKKGTKVLLITLLTLTILLALYGTYFLIKYLKIYKPKEKQTKIEYYTPTEAEIKRTNELANILKGNLPKMDGSTSTIPLEAGVIAKLFDISQENAEAGVVHSTTYGSFDNLLQGKCDIIFSTPISDQQRQQAVDAGLELVEKPIVYEGFVFVVNAKNPVDTLSQQQIKDIYSGKITNWKEVGGNDAEIVAYQRNETSGSQNYMNEFMKDSNLMKPKTTFVPASMVGLMDAVANYDNAENAIGYSVYAYAADMYGNGNEIKFIKVDGVEPTKATMASREYPLLNYNYAIYDKVKEATTTVDELTEWILTYDGQVAMVNAGYIPVKNVQITEEKITPYTKLGTGKERTKTKADDYYYTVSIESDQWNNYSGIMQDDKLVSLKDKELQEKINSFITESKEKLESKKPECDKYVELLRKQNTYGYSEAFTSNGVVVNAKCVNGYLSVKVVLQYEYQIQKGENYTYDGYSKVYDLYTGKELELSDLYYKDVDFIKEINKQIEDRIPKEIELVMEPIKTKRTFASVPNDISLYGIDTIDFTKYNPYFAEGVTFDIDTYLDNLSVIYEARDMKGIFDDNVKITRSVQIKWLEQNLQEKKIDNMVYYISYLNTKNTALNETINSYIDNNYIDNKKTEEFINKYFEEYPNEKEFFGSYAGDSKEITVGIEMYGNKYLEIYCQLGMGLIYNSITVFDLDTMQIVPVETLETWRDEIDETV